MMPLSDVSVDSNGVGNDHSHINEQPCIVSDLDNGPNHNSSIPLPISDIEGPVPNQHVLKIRGQGYHPEFVTEMPQEVNFYEDLPNCRAYFGDEGQ